MKTIILTAFTLLLFTGQLCAQQKEYNKGTAYLQFVTPIGCTMQIQSFNKTLSHEGLNKLVSILMGFPSDSRGLKREFDICIPLFPTLAHDSLKNELASRCQKEINHFDTTIMRLKAYQVPLQAFEELVVKLLENYVMRQKYNKIILSYYQTHDIAKFRRGVVGLFSNSEIINLFQKLEKAESLYERLHTIPSKIYNEMNQHLFPTLPIMELQEKLLKQSNIRFVYGECDG